MRRDNWNDEDCFQNQSEDGGISFGKLFLILFLLQDTNPEHVHPLIRFLWIAILGIPFMALGILGMWIPTTILGFLLLVVSIAGGTTTSLSFTKVFARTIWSLVSGVLIFLALNGLYPMLLIWWIMTVFHVVNYEIE